MKNLFLILLSLCYLSGHAQSNLGETPIDTLDKSRLLVTYKLQYQQDSTNSKEIRTEKMVLFIGDSISLFMSYNTTYNDTISENLKNVDKQIFWKEYGMKMQPSRFSYNIFKKYPKNKISTIENIFNDNYIYEEPLSLCKWKIEQGKTQTIRGYTVQKATTFLGGENGKLGLPRKYPLAMGHINFAVYRG